MGKIFIPETLQKPTTMLQKHLHGNDKSDEKTKENTSHYFLATAVNRFRRKNSSKHQPTTKPPFPVTVFRFAQKWPERADYEGKKNRISNTNNPYPTQSLGPKLSISTSFQNSPFSRIRPVIFVLERDEAKPAKIRHEVVENGCEWLSV